MTLIPDLFCERLAATTHAGSFQTVEAEIDADPLSVVRAGAHLFGNAMFLATPAGERIGGLGAAWRASAAGANRFGAIRDAIDDLALPAGLRVMLGYSFSDGGPVEDHWSGFNAADAVLPLISLHSERESRTVIRALVAPGSDTSALSNVLRSLRELDEPQAPDLGDHVIESHPHVSDWRDEVSEAVAAIRSDLLAKVVLSRSVVVRSTIHADGFDLVHHLARAYPGCYSFAWAADDAVFVGASPELLLRVEGTDVWTNPLAGSAARGEGEIEDRALGESLMASDKDRSEHFLVVDDVIARLDAHTTDLTVPSAPSLRRVATVQHLSTEIRGTLQPNVDVLDVVADLHPTPAVGGTPRPAAAAFIDKVERIDRGWYTGGIGWVEPGGDGMVALALRCGLVRGNTAHLYAGAGIVADSDPDQELVETRLKLRPLLELLAAT